MGVKKFVIYKGERFSLQTSGRYYQSGNKDSSERLLHRRVWVDANGPIPKGAQVHHKDGDWTNNELSNLECLDASRHQKYHWAERLKDPSEMLAARERMNVARVAASQWHGSSEGIAWHKEHGKLTWIDRKPVKMSCSVCSGVFEAFFQDRAKFCSTACAAKESYVRHKSASALCALCGASFMHHKYRVQECCSRSCANRLRAKREANADRQQANH